MLALISNAALCSWSPLNQHHFKNDFTFDDLLNTDERSEPLLPHEGCSGSKFTRNTTHEFPTSHMWSLHFDEQVDIPNLNGKIHIARGRPDQTAGIVLEIQTSYSSEEDYNRLDIDAHSSSMGSYFIYKSMHPRQPWQNPHPFEQCLSSLITIYVRPDTWLYTFDITSRNLPIELGGGAKFKVFKSTFSSGKDVACATAYDYDTKQYVYMNETSVYASKNIVGKWGLGDAMFMKAVYGNISVDLKPYLTLSDPEARTRLLLETWGHGDADVRMPTAHEELPERAYFTTARIWNGRLSGNFIHGVDTDLKSRNGTMDVTLLPYNVDIWAPSKITTNSINGTASVRVLEPINNPYYDDNVLGRTESTHIVGRPGYEWNPCCEPGNLVLTYPPSWSGKLTGNTYHGLIKIDMDVGSALEHHRWRPLNESVDSSYVGLRKGNGNSSMSFSVGHGGAEISLWS